VDASERSGLIRLTVQPNLFGKTRARVRVDGRPVPSSLGVNDIQVPPGRHLVEVADPFRTTSESMDVHVAPGQTLSLWYAPPYGRFDPGRLSSRPLWPRRYVSLFVLATIIVVGVLVEMIRG
jgi:hypothetical protein